MGTYSITTQIQDHTPRPGEWVGCFDQKAKAAEVQSLVQRIHPVWTSSTSHVPNLIMRREKTPYDSGNDGAIRIYVNYCELLVLKRAMNTETLGGCLLGRVGEVHCESCIVIVFSLKHA